MERTLGKDNTAFSNLIKEAISCSSENFDSKLKEIYRILNSVSVPNEKYKISAQDKEYMLRVMNRINSSKTEGRKKYYLKVGLKALSETKTNGVNDINLNRWYEYEDIKTDSLWLFPKRDTSDGNLGWYWGNFIPQIPHQLILRYTKDGDWIVDPFAGSGTTIIEARKLGRNALGIELNKETFNKALGKLNSLKFKAERKWKMIIGDALSLDYDSMMKEIGIKHFDLAILHPPYHNIIKFSNDPSDLSNAKSVEEFIDKMSHLSEIMYSILKKKGYVALVIGDKYEKGELVPLGFRTMDVFIKRGFKPKSIVVKNFDYTRGKGTQNQLWRYRALAGGYYVFKHEYIIIFEK